MTWTHIVLRQLDTYNNPLTPTLHSLHLSSAVICALKIVRNVLMKQKFKTVVIPENFYNKWALRNWIEEMNEPDKPTDSDGYISFIVIIQ